MKCPRCGYGLNTNYSHIPRKTNIESVIQDGINDLYQNATKYNYYPNNYKFTIKNNTDKTFKNIELLNASNYNIFRHDIGMEKLDIIFSNNAVSYKQFLMAIDSGYCFEFNTINVAETLSESSQKHELNVTLITKNIFGELTKMNIKEIKKPEVVFGNTSLIIDEIFPKTTIEVAFELKRKRI